MTRPAAIAIAVLAVLALGTAQAATRNYSSGRLTVAIPDSGTIERAISVPHAGPVSSVAVWVRIDHPRVSDLSLDLLAPDGTSVRLATRPGGPGRNFGSGNRGCSGQFTVFEDDAATPMSSGSAPFEGAFRPAERLSTLNGKQARGRWALRVRDDQTGQTGTLYCWQLWMSRDVVEVRRGRAGNVTAEISFRESDFRYRDVRLKIVRAGRTVLSRPLTRIGCRECPYWRPHFDAGDVVKVRDLDGDREPEVLFDFYTGGAHCCTNTVIYRYSGGRYEGKVFPWGNVGYRLIDLDRSGRPELSSHDDRFNYAFTAYVASVPPIRIWQYDQGRLVDVTRRFRRTVERDARKIWGIYLRARKSSFPEVRGVLAGYIADKYLLGEEEEGWRQLEAAFRRGELNRGAPGYPAGRAYLRKLRAFLRDTGYAR